MNDPVLQFSYNQVIGPFEVSVLIGPEGVVIHVRMKDGVDFES